MWPSDNHGGSALGREGGPREGKKSSEKGRVIFGAWWRYLCVPFPGGVPGVLF